MDHIRALHTAARRHCRARHDECWEEYRTIVLRLAREGKGYCITNEVTSEELAVYPRCLVDWAILKDVERFDPGTCTTLDRMREVLMEIGRDSTDEVVSNPANEPGTPAMDDERRRFIEYIASVPQRKLKAVKPLPFRRILTEDEARRLWSDISNAWGIKGQHWYPRPGGDQPRHAMAFHTDYFDSDRVEALWRIVSERGITRIWELRSSVGCEIELDSFYPSFDVSAGSDTLYGAGEEGYWTGRDKDWIVYASHENSITLAGEWLVSAFKNLAPGCEAFTFAGQISTLDRRGTW